jgi:hypothetical protein
MNTAKTFNQDTWVFFDRTEVNLKGYGYKINGCHIELLEKDMPRLKKEIGENLFNNARDISNDFDCDTIIFAQDEVFAESNSLSWSDYYKYLDIPKDWENISYGNDELPSFLYKDYKIWVNSPLLSERQESYLGIGFKNLDQYKDWIFTVCDYDLKDCECKDDIFQTMHFEEVLNFLKEQY